MQNYLSLAMSDGAAWGLMLVALVVGAGLMLVLMRMMGQQTLGNARREAEQIVRDAKNEAVTHQKQLELDARNEIAKRREEFERVTETTRNQIKEAEQRITKREDNLDRKLDSLTTKEKQLDELDSKIKQREAKLNAREGELEGLITQQKELLEKSTQEQKQVLLRISNLSPEEAKKEALRLVEEEIQHEAGQVIQRQMARAEDEAKDNALRITLQAIQRYAGEHTADNTVTTIDIPSDDMKGRVIGREGRNIRAFEKATGVDVIVDDTPGVVVISCFDPIRRVVAAESLRKLLEDGRIHPARIEEVVEQMQKEIERRIIRAGKESSIEANIRGLHPKVQEMMGRLQYRTSYGQNILKHSLEVAYLCQ
ncbi:MAG: DUF3552 domain-containing protein, partial [Phycisphaeraceae bacterium]|nr:DUF3552 domain-containing protein [Phycisphaeraceae bacterium]